MSSWSFSLSDVHRDDLADAARKVLKENLPELADDGKAQFEAAMSGLETIFADPSFDNAVVNIASHGHVRQNAEDAADTYVSISLSVTKQEKK